jgi:hypothetical protein
VWIVVVRRSICRSRWRLSKQRCGGLRFPGDKEKKEEEG